MKKNRLAIFASGSGSNCENIIRHYQQDPQLAETVLVVCNRPGAIVLDRAKRLGVPSVVITKAELNDASVMLPLLEQYDVTFIVLAGFLPLIPNFLIDAFPKRIINIHPALLPKYGGKGMFGHHVHEAVKAAGETVTGMTVHWVTPVCDAGEIIAQYSVALAPEDSPDDIAAKEHQLEMEFYPKVIDGILSGKLT
jgi:phosphoribosylglycinamide formyltransferase-1